jgi:hypothetical protein
MRDGYSLFDTHTHLGEAKHSGRVTTPDQLLRVMDRHGVDRSLAIPFPVVHDFRAAHDLIADAVRRHPERLAGAACLDPNAGERVYRDEVRRCREHLSFVALKVQPQYMAVNPLWRHQRYVFEAALENGMALVWHTGSGIPYSLPSLLMPVARDYPELQIVLAHCGGGGLLLGEAIVAAQFCQNIHLELSTLMPNHVLEVLQSVEPQRLLAGSDLVENTEVEFAKILGLEITAEAKQAILSGTALRLFGGAR